MRSVLGRLWTFRRAIGFYGLVLIAGWALGEQLRSVAIPEMRPMNEPVIHVIVMSALVIFVLAAAIPFVPGAEIGFALLLVFGGKAAAIVYAGMVGALLLSYCVARFVPLHGLTRLASWLRLKRVIELLDEIETTPPDQRANRIAGKLTGGFGRRLLRNRYLVLALLLNTPGNSLLGGGGGLAFFAGISGLYSFWTYLVTVMLAVAPFPLLFFLFGD